MNDTKYLNVVGTVLLIVFVVPFVIYAMPGVVGAEHSFVVLSGSMEPAISVGDAVVVGETDPATIEEGDVITFVRGNEETPVTHRVIGVEMDESGLAFVTKGDANEGADVSAVPAENVIGTVVVTIPFVGYVVRFVNTPLGFALLVALPIGALVATEVWSLVRAEEGESGDDEVPSTDGRIGLVTEVMSVLWGKAGIENDDAPSAPDGRSDPAIDPQVAADATAPPSSVEATDGSDELTVTITDLTATVALLVLLTPYTVYVAFALQTTTTITIAFASGFSALATGVLWLFAWIDGADERVDGDASVAPSASPPKPSTASSIESEQNDAHERGPGPATAAVTQPEASADAQNGSDGALFEGDDAQPVEVDDGSPSVDVDDGRKGNPSV